MRPYLSKSVSEFWRRWHISLGSWFREYVYIPLGGNRSGNVYLNLFIVFLLTGIWHGAGGPFLVWGVVHGICIIIERVIREKEWYRRTPAFLKWLITMTVIFFTWVLFMSDTLAAAGDTYQGLFSAVDSEAVNFTWQYYLTESIKMLLGVCIAELLWGNEIIQTKIQPLLTHGAGVLIKRTILLALFLIDILFVVNSTYSPFIYFQF